MAKPIDLKILWYQISSRYTSNNTLIAELWTEIEGCYSVETRYYHNLDHIAYMVSKAMEYKKQLADQDTLMFSIFYHDIVYDPQRGDNEERSAEIARQRLTSLEVPQEKIARCTQQILATYDHLNYNDNDTEYLLDFDLAYLGESRQNYRDYCSKIRKEYYVYRDAIYQTKRAKALQNFLDRDYIFHTDEFRHQYEKQARENLSLELRGKSL